MYLLTILHLATRIADYQTKTKRREKKISFKHAQDLAAIKRPEILKQEEEKRVRNAIEDFEDEISYFEFTEIRDRVSALKISGGKEIKKLAPNLPYTAPVLGDDDYKKLKRKLYHHILPKKNRQHARYTFNKQKQIERKRVVTYAARLREKSQDCEFGEETEDRILQHLIQTIKDSELVKKSIQRKCNLEQFLEEASQRENINQQVKDMKEDFKISKVEGSFERRHVGQEKTLEIETTVGPRKMGSQERKGRERKKMWLLWKNRSTPFRTKLPSIRTTVFEVWQVQQLCVMLQNRYPKPREIEGDQERERIKKTTEAEETSSGSDDDYIYLQETVQHLHRVKKIRSGPNQDTVRICIGDIDAFVERDSGASANVMDEYQFKVLKHRSQEIKELQPSRDTLKTLKSDLTVKGEFTATLLNKNRGTQSKFLVIQGKMNSSPPLSKSTLLELGMLKIDPEGRLKETNELRINTVKTLDVSIEAIRSEYSDVFQGIGCFREKNTGKKIKVKLEMETDANPVAQKPRPVPYHLQKPLKAWLDQGVKEEIFEKVPDGEAVTWCSPLVVQPKPKFTAMKNEVLESHMIRASIDMIIPNQSMTRSRCVQSPRVEDFLYRLHDCKIFTKLDLRQVYHQLALDPSTKQVATFSTPWGNYRPQRLVFGAKSSQDVFDKAMFRVFGDIHHCLNQRDDILLGGRDKTEHREVLKTVLKRARDHGITFNREKCQFGMEQIEFFGHVFSKDGLRPSPDKVRAVKECGQQTDSGIQPVHFINRAMTEAERRYSQTKKYAFAIKWAKERLRIYLLGAPRFRIVTTHKPLIPLFDRVKAKVPPSIEKWIMEMQDVGYELVYEPGKDEMDPFDFLSRHPLPETGDDKTDKIIRWNVNEEYAVVVTGIREETQKDEAMRRLAKRIVKGDWEKHKRDKDLKHYLHVKQELSDAEGLIFRERRIVLPPALQRKVVKLGHSLRTLRQNQD